MASDIPTLVCLVIGDSGVGKSAFVQSVCQNSQKSPPPTIGCNIDIKIYERRDRHELYFIEFHDISGLYNHKSTRSLFYDEFHGVILVHDLTSKQSFDNLRDWIIEVIQYKSRQSFPTEFCEDMLKGFDIPVLIVGTKLDEISNGKTLTPSGKLNQLSLLPEFDRKSKFANLFNCDEIALNCLSDKKLLYDSQNLTKLNSFFEKMIRRVPSMPMDVQTTGWIPSENHQYIN